jgi:hypothetical protein
MDILLGAIGLVVLAYQSLTQYLDKYPWIAGIIVVYFIVSGIERGIHRRFDAIDRRLDVMNDQRYGR